MLEEYFRIDYFNLDELKESFVSILAPTKEDAISQFNYIFRNVSVNIKEVKATGEMSRKIYSLDICNN